MGFRDSLKQRIDEREGAKANAFGPICLDSGRVLNSETAEGGSVKGAHATVETSGELEKRVTATRLILTGPLAFGLRKKKDTRQLFLTVEGEDFAFVVEVDPKKQTEARQFAARINTAGKQQ